MGLIVCFRLSLCLFMFKIYVYKIGSREVRVMQFLRCLLLYLFTFILKPTKPLTLNLVLELGALSDR